MLKKKQLLVAICMLAIVMAVVPLFMAHANRPLTVTVDGCQISFSDKGPIIVYNRVLVPVRGVFENMGFNAEWDSDTRLARLEGNGIIVLIPADSSVFYVNNIAITPDVPQRIKDNRMLLPLRAIAEAIGGTAEWDSINRVAKIISNQPITSPTPSPTPTFMEPTPEPTSSPMEPTPEPTPLPTPYPVPSPEWWVPEWSWGFPPPPQIWFSSIDTLRDGVIAARLGYDCEEFTMLAELTRLAGLEVFYIPINLPDEYEFEHLRVDSAAITIWYRHRDVYMDGLPLGSFYFYLTRRDFDDPMAAILAGYVRSSALDGILIDNKFVWARPVYLFWVMGREAMYMQMPVEQRYSDLTTLIGFTKTEAIYLLE